MMSHAAVILEIIGVFALMATMTPNKADDKIIQVVLDAVNTFGLNVGRAKNG